MNTQVNKVWEKEELLCENILIQYAAAGES
jgi:hypothetical protein